MKPKIREVIVVEGRYDKNTLLQVVDATVVETEGFGIFHNREKLELLRRLGRQRGLILLTDSDGAGFVIRNHLKGSLPVECIKQAYIPDVAGKERRKKQPGREGKLGVEGMTPQVLLETLRRCGATFEDGAAPPLKMVRRRKRHPSPRRTCWKRDSSAPARPRSGSSFCRSCPCRSISRPTPCWKR